MWSYVATAVLSACIAFGAGIQWQLGVQARATLAADDIARTDAKQQQHLVDRVAANHAANLVAINQKLGNAREKIAKLSGRECLDSGTVGVLNSIGGEPVPATASDFASETGAASLGAGLRFATERDIAGAIAICRARYAEVASQVNSILDIEEKRNP